MEPHPKADLTRRIIAGVIDAAITMVVGFIPWLGGLLATGYWLVRDGLDLEFMDHRSIGKKLMKLRPVTADGQPTEMVASVKRNWPLAFGGVAQLLLFIPIIGWILLIPVVFIAFAVGIVEVVLVITDSEGRRLGDRFAGTRVVETES
jgi:uncharacterized RDD family membrane protein YckC